MLNNGDYVTGSAILYRRLGELDADLAIEHALHTNSMATSNWIRSIFFALARVDVGRAAELVDSLPEGFRQNASQAILRSRDDLPYSERSALALQLDTRVPTHEPGLDIEQSWANALNNPNQQARQNGLMRTTTQIAMTDPIAALNLINELNSAQERRALQSQVIDSWGRSNAKAAVDWLLANNVRNDTQLLSRALGAYARTDPHAAMEIAEGLKGDAKLSSTNSVVSRWVSRDPDSAFAWFNEQTDARVRETAVASLVSSMADREFYEIEQWLDTLEPSESRVAESYLGFVITQGNPIEVLQQVENIRNKDRQTNLAKSLIQNWAQTDPRRSR